MRAKPAKAAQIRHPHSPEIAAILAGGYLKLHQRCLFHRSEQPEDPEDSAIRALDIPPETRLSVHVVNAPETF